MDTGSREPETQNARFPARAVKLAAWAVTVFASLVVLGLGSLLVVFWIGHKIPVTLPAPTGPYPVGRAMYSWEDRGEPGAGGPHSAAERTVLVWIWYPAKSGWSGRPVEYLPPAWRSARAHYSGRLMTNFLNRDYALIRVHATDNPPVAPQERSYPAILLRAGGGALTTDFSLIRAPALRMLFRPKRRRKSREDAMPSEATVTENPLRIALFVVARTQPSAMTPRTMRWQIPAFLRISSSAGLSQASDLSRLSAPSGRPRWRSSNRRTSHSHFRKAARVFSARNTSER
jgi:hypothetical protein